MLEFYNHKLETFLIKHSPPLVRAAKIKEVTTKPIPIKAALMKCDFIEFNSEQRISWLVYDIDNPPEYVVDVFQFANYVQYYLLLPRPTYVCKTHKGFHVAYLLKYGVLATQTDAMRRMAFVHAALSKLLNADPNASRTRGIWRNPIRHEHTFCDRSYLLDELVENHGELVNPGSPENVLSAMRSLQLHTPVASDTKKSLATTNTMNVKIFLAKLLRAMQSARAPEPIVPTGYRKSVLFQAAMLRAKKYDATQSLLLEYLDKSNLYLDAPLPQNEIDNILKSVWKYKEHNSIFVKNPLYNTREKRMNLKEELPLHVKQRKAAGFANRVRVEKSKTGIEIAVKTLYKQKRKITLSSLSNAANLSRQTVAKYQDVIERTLLCVSKAKLRDFFLSLRFLKPVNYALICFTAANPKTGASPFPIWSPPMTNPPSRLLDLLDSG